jgi:hypothetical protein
MLAKPDYNNKIYYKDKGKGVKTEIKSFKFPEGEGMPVEDRKKKDFPGPGAYGISNKLELTTFSQKAPAFSMRASGQMDFKRK